jgi:hypothetical protein
MSDHLFLCRIFSSLEENFSEFCPVHTVERLADIKHEKDVSLGWFPRRGHNVVD